MNLICKNQTTYEEVEFLYNRVSFFLEISFKQSRKGPGAVFVTESPSNLVFYLYH